MLLACSLAAQSDTSYLAKKLAEYKIQFSAGVQLWAAYSNGFKAIDPETGRFGDVDDRLDLQFRRSRFTIKGEPYSGLRFNVTAAVDFVGRDLFSSTEAGNNNGASPRFRIWNAFVQWRLSSKSDALHITSGYMVPNIGRESMTPALAVPSFEKAWSQNYLRRHLVGTGPGRAVGFNLGGMTGGPKNYTHVSYDFGMFRYVGTLLEPSVEFKPLVTGRIAIHVADPEWDNYSTSHKVNYFGRRNGWTFAISAAQRGSTANSYAARAYGGDFLFNRNQFHFDGDMHYLRAEDPATGDVADGNTGYLRAGFNIDNRKGGSLNPTIMYWWLNGSTQQNEQEAADRMGFFSGNDSAIDIGLNYHFNPQLTLSLHYTFRDGDPGDLERENVNNNYFRQVGLEGPVERGDYAGLGLIAAF
ncbi:hypothetical protein CEQ90_08055 [Lewinellaceae bacterium SD302]|nr:hypothetical protein CEQ90_08055 [Lewinellaceae bacterium SD302]